LEWFAELLARLGLRRTARPAGPRGGRRQADAQITHVERSVTTTWLPSGRKQRRTTSEWRHGNCPVRHKSEQAAAQCRRA
jgi:hypothetical protein